jgi:hypothetical protein
MSVHVCVMVVYDPPVFSDPDDDTTFKTHVKIYSSLSNTPTNEGHDKITLCVDTRIFTFIYNIHLYIRMFSSFPDVNKPKTQLSGGGELQSLLYYKSLLQSWWSCVRGWNHASAPSPLPRLILYFRTRSEQFITWWSTDVPGRLVTKKPYIIFLFGRAGEETNGRRALIYINAPDTKTFSTDFIDCRLPRRLHTYSYR